MVLASYRDTPRAVERLDTGGQPSSALATVDRRTDVEDTPESDDEARALSSSSMVSSRSCDMPVQQADMRCAASANLEYLVLVAEARERLWAHAHHMGKYGRGRRCGAGLPVP